MVYTNAKTVDMDRATYEEIDLLKSLMWVQYEGENGVILYNPALKDKLYLVSEKIA